MKREKPVFISYARRTSGAAASALHRELGDAMCFFDVHDIETAAHFPERLSNALLGARVVVALVDDVYFARWYCLREWMLALAPWRSAIERRVEDSDDALEHLTIVLPDRLSLADQQRLPPPVQRLNWINANDTKAIAKIVRRRLKGRRPTVREQLKRFHVPVSNRDLLVSEAMLSFPPLRLTTPQNLENVPLSIGDRFVGRANELWGVHDLLSTLRCGNDGEARACALSGMAGSGKTRIAIEYARRFGPAHYPGGTFWLNATDASTLPGQFRSILSALDVSPEGTAGSEDELRQQLAASLVRQSARGPILYIIDNLPESGPGERVPPLQHYCPALGHVSCLITSHVIQGYGNLVRPIAIDVLDPAGARLLLSQGSEGSTYTIGENDWNDIAAWCGRLPLALEVLHGLLVTGAATAAALVKQARRRAHDVVPTLAHYEGQLRRNVAEDLVPGVGEAFEFSYARLHDLPQWMARYFACLAPAPVPVAFLQVAADVQPVIDDAIGLLVARSLLKRVGPEQRAIEMHPVLASFLRSAHGSPHEDRMVFRSLAEHFAKLPDAERDPESRQLMLDLLVHLRWHAARWRERRADASLDQRDLDLIESGVLPSLQGLANSADSEACAHAIIELCDLLEARQPRELGAIHAHRGTALLALGEWEASTDRLWQALECMQTALPTYTKQQHPLVWAQLQDNLGSIQFRLGERADDTDGAAKLLDAARTAFEAALEVYSKEEHRVPWARLHNHVGMVWTRLSELEQSPNRRIAFCIHAVEEHGLALEAYRADEFDSRAVTLSNRGAALSRLAESTGQADDFARAVADHRAALAIYTKDRRPIRWAMSASNLAVVLVGLAERRAGHEAAALLAEAAGVEQDALTVLTKAAQHALIWASVQITLGRIRAKQAERANRVRFRRDAAAAFRAALDVLSEHDHPREWSSARDGLDAVLRAAQPQRTDQARRNARSARVRNGMTTATPKRTSARKPASKEKAGTVRPHPTAVSTRTKSHRRRR